MNAESLRIKCFSYIFLNTSEHYYNLIELNRKSTYRVFQVNIILAKVSMTLEISIGETLYTTSGLKLCTLYARFIYKRIIADDHIQEV